jgi:uridine kinase
MIIVGICGGTGSGKTTVAQKVHEAIGGKRVLSLAQDSYYKDHSYLPMVERARLNFDHPDALDTDLLIAHLERLKQKLPVDQPVYDFTSHIRKPELVRLWPHPVIIVEGILIFENQRLRELFDLRVYVDTAPDVRFIRRLQRDITERGRSLESVIRQYMETVRPMHLKFVEVIIPEGGLNTTGVETLIERIRAALL